VEQRDAAVPTTALYRAYERYCTESGTDQLGRIDFRTRLEEKGFARGPKVRGQRAWRGLGLKPTATADEPEEADDAALPF